MCYSGRCIYENWNGECTMHGSVMCPLDTDDEESICIEDEDKEVGETVDYEKLFEASIRLQRIVQGWKSA